MKQPKPKKKKGMPAQCSLSTLLEFNEFHKQSGVYGIECKKKLEITQCLPAIW